MRGPAFFAYAERAVLLRSRPGEADRLPQTPRPPPPPTNLSKRNPRRPGHVVAVADQVVGIVQLESKS
jgi:hypothetical protein